MTEKRDEHQSTLIDRLAATTLRLRNLFYFNLLLAAAVIFLVFQDPTFVSEKIDPAVDTLEQTLKVDRHLKANREDFQDYHLSLLQAFDSLREMSRRIDEGEVHVEKLTPEEQERIEAAAKRELTAEERDLFEDLAYVHHDAESVKRLFAGYFDLDLAAVDYPHLAGFAAFLLFEDSWTQALEKIRGVVVKVERIVPMELLGPAARDVNVYDLGLEHYNNFTLKDTQLENLLDDLPKVGEFFQSIMIVETFCEANNLGTCSINDIRVWQEARDLATSGKLSAPVIEVQIARNIVVPASPLALLVAFHLYVLQFRRRQVLRGQLATGLSQTELNLLDEAWVLNGLLLNITTFKGIWRQIQSALMVVFLVFCQAAPLVAVLVAGYYTFNQLLLVAFIAEEMAWAFADLKEVAATIGVERLPDPPAPPGLALEYLWIAVAGTSAALLLGSLVQVLRSQAVEIYQTWRQDPAR